MTKWFYLLLAGVLMVGCGNVDWFPEGTENTSAPNSFNFPIKSNVPLSTVVQSDPVTITGNQPAGWAITIANGTTGANSQYSINGDAFRSTAGTILPNQSLRVQQTSASTNSTTTTSVVTIGTLTKTFQSVTVAQ